MLFVLGSLLAIAFLDPPARFFVVGALALVEVAEIFIFLKWRRVRAMTGSEGMLGLRGKALTDCDPEGQITLKGQIWKARCREGVAAGEEVIVTGSEGLALDVSPAPEKARKGTLR